MAKKKQKISKAKKKQTEDPWPRITLQSPVADVVRVIEPIVQSYRLMRPVDLEQAVRFISGGHSTSIHTYCFESEEPIIDRVCDWLRKNNKDLYDQVYPRWQKLTNLIERTDQFILDALETKGLNRMLPDIGTNVNLRKLFVSVKNFAAILEDTATNLRENTTRKNKPKKTKSHKKAGKGKTKSSVNKKRDTKRLFRFKKSQAFFNDDDLGLPTGAEINPAIILKKLVKSFGNVVPYKDLDENSGDTASDFLRGKIRVIRNALKRGKVPCKIEPKRWAGYILNSSRSHS